ncbi:hypothetical protein [Streptomyces sp. DG1A-41]|uniref:hypothetical protein n=1 Tax=Streptomyces sp. DG1A-41 TaxID=3125779 RepID=UPI0030D4104C
MKRAAGTTLAVLVLVVTGAACSPSSTPDAPVNRQETGSADIYSMPEDFPSVAAKCDGYGHRIFVSEDGEKAGFDISVVADPKCLKKETD